MCYVVLRDPERSWFSCGSCGCLQVADTCSYSRNSTKLGECRLIDPQLCDSQLYMTGFRKTDPNRTFGILRITNLKYSADCESLLLGSTHGEFTIQLQQLQYLGSVLYLFLLASQHCWGLSSFFTGTVISLIACYKGQAGGRRGRVGSHRWVNSSIRKQTAVLCLQ